MGSEPERTYTPPLARLSLADPVQPIPDSRCRRPVDFPKIGHGFCRTYFHINLQMNRLSIILFLLFTPVILQAQAIGQVGLGARVFSTGFPARMPDEYFEDGGPKMSKERREIAIKCIERTFGKIKEHVEYWGDCTGEHLFVVTLESGDEICFADGCMVQYDIVSSRFSVGSDVLEGGLRVGQKVDLQKSRGEWIIRQDHEDSSIYDFAPTGIDDRAYFIVDENGIILSIHTFSNDC